MPDPLPQPLVPPEVDLRDFNFIPFEFRRLLASDTWLLGNAEQRCAAFCLWCESWHQVPSGSIPDSEKVLAHLSQSENRWNRVKDHALRGWIKCSDGRLYHPVVAEKALEAWAKHKKASSKGKAGAAKRWGTANSASNAIANSAGNGAGNKQLMPGDSNRSGSGSGSGIEPSKTSAPALTTAGAWAIDLKRRGVSVTSMDPRLLEWIEEGFTLPDLVEAVERARNSKPEPEKIPVAYLNTVLRNPPKPSKKSWYASESATIAKGKELGLEARPGEEMDQYRDRLRTAGA